MGGKPKAPPAPKPAPVIPLPDDEAIQNNNKRRNMANSVRSGRLSTMMSDVAGNVNGATGTNMGN